MEVAQLSIIQKYEYPNHKAESEAAIEEVPRFSQRHPIASLFIAPVVVA